MTSLDKHRDLFTLPHLRQIHLSSIRRFLQVTLLAELKWFGHVEGENKPLKFQLVTEAYRLERPQLNEREAVRTLTTYELHLHVPVRFADTIVGQRETHLLWLGSIPIVNSSGTFVIRGVSRCLVNQMLRLPGIYYTRDAMGTCIATIICNSGSRLRLELSQEADFAIRITDEDKISIALPVIPEEEEQEEEEARQRKQLQELEQEANEEEEREQQEQAQKEAEEQPPEEKEEKEEEEQQQQQEQQDGRAQEEKEEKEKEKQALAEHLLVMSLGDKVIQSMLDLYDLGAMGRLSLNKKLYTGTYGPKEPYLAYGDIALIVKGLIEVSCGIRDTDDIDEVNYKYIRSVGEIMSEQLKSSLVAVKRRVIRRMSFLELPLDSSERLPSPNRLIGESLVTFTFNHFFGSYQLSQFLDQTNAFADTFHKRRLSALGPGGLTPRTATFRSRDIQPSQYGRLCPVDTAEGQRAGIVTSFAVSAQVDVEGTIKNPFWTVNTMATRGCKALVLSAGQDTYSRISTGHNLAVLANVYDRRTNSVQYRREFIGTQWGQVQLRNILPIHHFSAGVGLIPFLEHNDATRALMGSTMQRQAVPLVDAEKAIVGTGLEAQVALDSGTVIRALSDGKIEYTDGDGIVSVYQDGVHSESRLTLFQKSNYNTCIHQQPAVHAGEFVRRGQLLADGASTVDGELALGKNVLVAYMPWDGHNFEDAVLISERLVCEDVYTSMNMKRYEAGARQTIDGDEEIITKCIPHVRPHLLRHLDERGVVSLGAWVEAGDVLVGRLSSPIAAGLSPENQFLQFVFNIVGMNTKETCVKVPIRAGGRVIDVRWVDRDSNVFMYSEVIHVFVLQKRKIKVGDKVAGRHGNKGVVSRILCRRDMPYLQDGTPIDMLLSPLGVPSRMNVGQVFECLLGLSGDLLNKHYRIMPFDERYEREASRKLVLSELYKARQSTGFPSLFEYEHPGKSCLFDGRTGNVLEQCITVGRAYMLKLIHQVDDKIHARSTGPYALVTQQPLRGKAKKGGQRLGEMEVWALEGFGAAHVLQEMILHKSDHVRARSEAVTAISYGNHVSSPVGAQDSLRLLVRELRCLGIHINHKVASQRDLREELREL